MPAYLPKSQKQHSTHEANQSRLITKTRWIVEARNGHVKSVFKFFRDMIDIHHLPNLGDFFRIACAILNAFHTTIHMKCATEELAKQLKESARTIVNVVQARVEVDRLDLDPQSWISMTEVHLPGFPTLSEEYLRNLTVGV